MAQQRNLIQDSDSSSIVSSRPATQPGFKFIIFSKKIIQIILFSSSSTTSNSSISTTTKSCFEKKFRNN